MWINNNEKSDFCMFEAYYRYLAVLCRHVEFSGWHQEALVVCHGGQRDTLQISESCKSVKQLHSTVGEQASGSRGPLAILYSLIIHEESAWTFPQSFMATESGHGAVTAEKEL